MLAIRLWFWDDWEGAVTDIGEMLCITSAISFCAGTMGEISLAAGALGSVSNCAGTGLPGGGAGGGSGAVTYVADTSNANTIC